MIKGRVPDMAAAKSDLITADNMLQRCVSLVMRLVFAQS